MPSSSADDPHRGRWWKRAAAALKDQNTLLLARANLLAPHHTLRSSIISATSHDDASIDYCEFDVVLSAIRSSPAIFLPVAMRAITRRVNRTSSWVVALKSLMLTHAILLCSTDIPAVSSICRLPFDLSGFRDRYASPGKSQAFSLFVRAYFGYLDHRSATVCSTETGDETGKRSGEADDDEIRRLQSVEQLQELLGFLLQVRAYGNGMEVGLILEAMDGIVTEVFEVYGDICDGIAGSPVAIFGSARGFGKAGRGKLGIRVLRKAIEQSSQLATFFDACGTMGVAGGRELPCVESVPEEDVDELERMMEMMEDDGAEIGVMETRKWEVFDEDVV